MLILHLSDLHVTEAGQNLATSWLRVQAALDEAAAGPIGLVVISGDLSQRAQVREYTELREFLETRILPLVAGDRTKVLLVPGNHDVDWTAKVAAPIRLASPETDLDWVEKALRRYEALPDQAELRIEIGRHGHFDLWKLDPALYAGRLANVQALLDGFYGDALERAGGRKLQLTSALPADHFSAHLFPQEGLAFFGFSSLHRNDRFWTGASISPEAVANAQVFARRLDPAILRAAVWHHGFTAERGRPDSLTAQDLGALHAAGFRVGFHGHTHRAAADLSGLFEQRFAIIATGSYGAASQDRPDAVGNQFSLVRLDQGSALVDIFEKSGEAGVYQARVRRYFDLSRAPRRSRAFERHAALHRRSFRVRKDGLARAQVHFEGLQGGSGALLAVVAPPFCSVLANESATTPHGSIAVARELLEDGRQRFNLQHGAPRLLPQLSWEYVVSNALALDRAELPLLEDRRRHYSHLDGDEELLCHTVRFHSDRLELSLEYEADTGAAIESARVFVERQAETDGELRWERALDEELRCELTAQKSRAQLSVRGPLVVCRYGIAFRLEQRQEAYPPGLALHAGELLADCAGREPAHAPGDLGLQLTALVLRVLANRLRAAEVLRGADTEPLGPRTTVMGMLWDAQRRLLRPAFGRFWTQSWAARFACGEGLAGHAFRFALPAAYHADAATARVDRSIVFQPHPHHYLQPRNYRWLLSLPLKATEHRCIGVVTFAAEEESAWAGERHLAHVARVAALGVEEKETAAFLAGLQKELSATFWTAVADAPGTGEPLRRFARGVLGLDKQA